MSKNLRNIIVMGLIVVLVVGVWVYKNGGKEEELEIYVDTLDIEFLKLQGKPILIDFTAEWCVPCKTFNPILEKVNEDFKGKVIIQIIDVDKSQDIARRYPIKAIPSQILIDSTGEPYTPSENLSFLGFEAFSKNGSDEKDLVIHTGAFSEEHLISVLKEMGLE